MHAILLAAGKGRRMWPLCTTTPKPLLSFAGRTLLHRMLDNLQAAGVTDTRVVVHHGRAKVESAVRAWRGTMEVKAVRQKAPRGTADAVATGARGLSGDALVVMGDCIAPVELLTKLAKSRGFVVAAGQVSDARRYGLLGVAGRKVTSVKEKPVKTGAGLVNTGLYRVPADALVAAGAVKASKRGEFEFTDVLGAWARKGNVSWVKAKGWLDLGTPWDLLALLEARLGPELDFLLDGAKQGGPGTIEPGVQVRGRLYAAAGAVVKSGVYIEGDVFVGNASVVGPNSYLRGPILLGAGCKVGANCEVKASVLLDKAQVPHLSYVGDSVLGEACNLGAGTVIANLRHDTAPVRVHHVDGPVDTGRRKLGAIIGDGAKTGVNCTLNPGTILGPQTMLAAGAIVRGTQPTRPRKQR